MASQGVKLPADYQQGGSTKLIFRRVMQLWMPAGQCVGNMIVEHVPGPRAAQPARAEALAAGPTDGACAAAVRACDPAGPVLVHIAKFAPISNSSGRFYAVGRVYSGTLSASSLHVLDEEHLPAGADSAATSPAATPLASVPVVPELPEAGPELLSLGPLKEGEEEEEVVTPRFEPKLAVETSPTNAGKSPSSSPKSQKASPMAMKAAPLRRIQGIHVCQTSKFPAVLSLQAGNIVALSGVDQFISKRCTLSSNPNCHPIRAPAFLISPVIRVSVAPKNMKDLPKCVEALRRLSKSCPLVGVKMEDTGNHVVAACGNEHIRVLRRDLEDEYAADVPLTWGVPSVTYKETITEKSSKVSLSKSPNKHNRLFVTAEPCSNEFCQAVEGMRIWEQQDQKERAKILVDELGWEKNDALKIWGFGPAAETAGAAVGSNILVDQTHACQYLNEIKQSVNSGLLWASKQGPLCEEAMRGIRFNLMDVKLHTDSIHRGMGQIQPTARRVLFSSSLLASPRMSEPVFLCSIDATPDAAGGIMQALTSCRGEFVLQEDVADRITVQAYIPIVETIGETPFATVLTQKTSGKAFASYVFDHWDTMPSDPLKEGTKSYELIMRVRKEKGLKVQLPVLTDYLDKL